MEALHQQPSEFGQRVVDASSNTLIELGSANASSNPGKLGSASPVHKLWEEYVGKVFLGPFGLNKSAYMAGSPDDVLRISKDNPSLRSKHFLTPRPDRRNKWLAVSTILNPHGYDRNVDDVVSIDIGPDYVGVPGGYINGKVNGGPVSYEPHLGNGASLSRLVGGGLLETFAFGGDAPTAAMANTGEAETVVVGAPETPFTLADSIGMSSWAVGSALPGLLASLASPHAKYWPISSEKFPEQQEALTYEFGDGGNHDNSGLLSLLVRGAEKVLWVASSDHGLNMSYEWEGACAKKHTSCEGTYTFDPVKAGLVDQVLDKFGYGPKVSDFANLLAHNKVFNQCRLLPLACDIYSLVEKGEPAVVSFSEEVQPNHWYGITGGYTVEVVIFYLDKSKKFEKLLPTSTQQQLSKSRDTWLGGELNYFPHYKTIGQNFGSLIALNRAQVNLLAAQGEYSVHGAKDQIGRLLQH